MFDKWMLTQAKRPLIGLAERLKAANVTPDQITLVGFGFALVSFACIALGQPLWGLLFIALNRLADGLDGALARLTRSSDRGAFLDITLDFLFYSLIPLGFAIHDPVRNALPAATVIFSFVGTGSSFLAFAIIAAKRKLSSTTFPQKSFYYMGGLTEATETLLFFILSVLFPALFPIFAYVFAGLCLITTVLRIHLGWQAFHESP